MYIDNVELWEKMISDKHSEYLDWIKNKVDIEKFMTHFKGKFNGVLNMTIHIRHPGSSVILPIPAKGEGSGTPLSNPS